MSRSAKARAARLVRLVERAIEAGEFTPEVAYLGETKFPVGGYIGPCGCAMAAASVATGIRQPSGVSRFDRDLLVSHLRGQRLRVAEIDALEAAYEGYASMLWDREDHERLSGLAPEFYAAGRELRKFNPHSGARL